MLEGPAFIVIAGHDLVESLRAEKKRRVQHTGFGYASEDLCALQREQASRGVVGCEVIVSSTGCSVRYDSGLQNFGPLASGRCGDLPSNDLAGATAWATQWVARDPDRRYAWRRA